MSYDGHGVFRSAQNGDPHPICRVLAGAIVDLDRVARNIANVEVVPSTLAPSLVESAACDLHQIFASLISLMSAAREITLAHLRRFFPATVASVEASGLIGPLPGSLPTVLGPFEVSRQTTDALESLHQVSQLLRASTPPLDAALEGVRTASRPLDNR